MFHEHVDPDVVVRWLANLLHTETSRIQISAWRSAVSVLYYLKVAAILEWFMLQDFSVLRRGQFQ